MISSFKIPSAEKETKIIKKQNKKKTNKKTNKQTNENTQSE